MTLLIRTIPALVLGLVLVACGEETTSPSPSTATTATASATPSATAVPTDTASPSASADASASGEAGLPDGWQRVGVAEQGFSVAIPEDWEEISPDVIGDSGVMDELTNANPDAAEALQQAQAAIESGQIALFAFDAGAATDETGFATNLNVINVGPVEGTAEDAAEEVAEAIRQQIPVTGDVETETVSLPAGEAALLRYEWEVDDGQGTVTAVTVRQYAIIADGGTGFILSMSAATEAADEYADTFEQIAESFREEAP